MKKRFQIIAIIFIFVISTGFDNDDTWAILKDKTWRCDDFAGSEIIFYDTPNGLRKAMLQIHGSGVMLVKVTLFDVEIGKDEIFIKDGMHQFRTNCRGMQTIRITLVNDSLFKIDKQLYRKKHDRLVALNWEGKPEVADTLDIERLKSISIGKQSVYPKDSFRN